jgi:plasmid stabilization system protein ParE
MVIWKLRARADLKAVHDYIAKDSRQNAKRVAHEIRRKAEALAEPPRVGRKVPELITQFLLSRDDGIRLAPQGRHRSRQARFSWPDTVMELTARPSVV